MGRVASTKEMSVPFSSSRTHSGRIQNDYGHDNSKRGSSETRAPQSSSSSAGFSIGQRSQMSRLEDDKRGPGAYLSIWDHSQGPAYSFCGKRTPDRKRHCNGPGPGEYSSGSGYYATKSSAPAYSMGARCGPSAFSTGSGTEVYDVVKNTRGSSNDVAYRLAYKSGQNFSLVPGPGTYNTSTMPCGPSYSMGTKSRLRSLDRSHSPGPGAYDVTKKTSGPSFSIAPKARKQVYERDTNPGPGNYSNVSNPIDRAVSHAVQKRLK